MQAHVMAILAPSEQKVLRALLDAYPEPLSREGLMEATGYSPGGRFQRPGLGLRSLGLVYYPTRPCLHRAVPLHGGGPITAWQDEAAHVTADGQYGLRSSTVRHRDG
jgi:hypothetical protein